MSNPLRPELPEEVFKRMSEVNLKEVKLSDEEFVRMTRYLSSVDSLYDDRRRAVALGLHEPAVLVAPGAIVRVGSKGSVAQNVFIGLYSYVNGNVTIEENVLIGPRCSLTAGQHKFDPATGWYSARTEPDGDESIVIGRGSWLCSNVTVTPGVKIGKANLVCAGAVVTKDTPDYAIMAGMPARQIGHVDPETGVYHWNK